jgi:phage tail-like protein
MPAARRENPYGAFNFLVEFEGKVFADFTEVTGLGIEIVDTEYRSGSDPNASVRKIPGLSKYPNVVLKRGVTSDQALYEWAKNVRDGAADQRDVDIVLLDETRQPVLRWTLKRAQPKKWTGPTLNAKGNEIAIESLELSYEDLTLQGP